MAALIFSAAEPDEREFLLQWVNVIMVQFVDEIIIFVMETDLQGMSLDVLAEFAELKRVPFEDYSLEGKAYGQDWERRAEKYQTLMLQMQNLMEKRN